jgi:hypothetical protein
LSASSALPATVVNDMKSEDLLRNMKYERPEIKQDRKMTFMFDALKGQSKIACRQCSSCHGCR